MAHDRITDLLTPLAVRFSLGPNVRLYIVDLSQTISLIGNEVGPSFIFPGPFYWLYHAENDLRDIS